MKIWVKLKQGSVIRIIVLICIYTCNSIEYVRKQCQQLHNVSLHLIHNPTPILDMRKLSDKFRYISKILHSVSSDSGT